MKGLSLSTVIGVIFVVLKLTGNITWSWFWVTLPFWWGVPFALIILLIIPIIKRKNNLSKNDWKKS